MIIAESIKRLNYTPNTTAQHLRSKSSNSICILIPDIGSYIWGKTCNAILTCMKLYKYSVIIRSYSKSSIYTQDIQFLLSKQIDGVILFTEYTVPEDFIQLIKESKIPLVCINQKPNQETDFVSTTYFQTTFQATEFLIKNGHHSIALFGVDSYSSHQCKDGFFSACKKHSLNTYMQHILFFKNTNELQSSCPQTEISTILHSSCPPTALLLLDYHTTMLFASNHKVLQNFSIISLSDDEILSALNPPLTVFEPNFISLGKNITELLLKRISGDYTEFPQSIFCDSIFHKRKSVSPVPVDPFNNM